MSFSSSANSQYFFPKILGIGSWVSRINWCKGHWCCSTDMVIRLSEVRSKTTKKMYFTPFWASVWQPDHHVGWATSMPFASIYPTHPRTNPWNFCKNILRIGGVFFKWKSPWLSYEVAFISALRMVSSESWKRLYPN